MEVRSPELEDGRRKTEDRRRKAGRPKTEDRRPKTEDRRRKTEVGRRKLEDRRPKTEGWKTEDGRPKTEDGRWKMENRRLTYRGWSVFYFKLNFMETKEKIICTCMEVTENEIVDAIKTKNCDTFEKVRDETGAGGVCGGCKGIINRIIEDNNK